MFIRVERHEFCLDIRYMLFFWVCSDKPCVASNLGQIMAPVRSALPEHTSFLEVWPQLAALILV